MLQRKTRRGNDGGFSLMEVMIAMLLSALVMAAALPAFIGMLKSTVTVKLDTQAKNLAQARIEQMRDLRFHIDRQNGPFLDLLDMYYTNAKAATPTSLSMGGSLLTGQYVSTASATPDQPLAPYFRVITASVAGTAGFTQTIYTQFLAPDGSVIPASTFQDIYDSQIVGRDQPPSLMVGVTVITRWTDAGHVHKIRTNTRIAEGRPTPPMIQTQARAVAVDIASTAADGTTLRLQTGISSADGTQTNGSTAAGYVTGALATQTGLPPVSGLLGQFNLPSQGLVTSGDVAAQSGVGCGWFGFGHTALGHVSGDVSVGLPKIPADVDPLIPANMLTGSVTDNGGGSCGLLSYDNLYGGGLARPASDLLGALMGPAPYVGIADSGSGSAAAVAGSSYVVSNLLTATPQTSASGATAFVKRPLVLFPQTPASGGRGLVSIMLNSASVDCSSGTASRDGSLVGKYSLTMGWWGKGKNDPLARWHTATWNYNSSSFAEPTLTLGSDLWDPTTTQLGGGVLLSQLVNGATPASVNVGTTSGLRGFTDGIFSLITAPTLANESGLGYSGIKVHIGQLTCVADDQR